MFREMPLARKPKSHCIFPLAVVEKNLHNLVFSHFIMSKIEITKLWKTQRIFTIFHTFYTFFFVKNFLFIYTKMRLKNAFENLTSLNNCDITFIVNWKEFLVKKEKFHCWKNFMNATTNLHHLSIVTEKNNIFIFLIFIFLFLRRI